MLDSFTRRGSCWDIKLCISLTQQKNTFIVPCYVCINYLSSSIARINILKGIVLNSNLNYEINAVYQRNLTMLSEVDLDFRDASGLL